MRMHSALTQWEVTPALVTLAILEMVSAVQVSCLTPYIVQDVQNL